MVVAFSLHTLKQQREFFFSTLFEVCALPNGKWETQSHASSSQLASLTDPKAELVGIFWGPLHVPWVAGTLETKPIPCLLCSTLAPHQVNSQCRLANNIAESLAESAAAYTKATARKCLLEKVEVITGEEAESNVLQVRWASWPLGAIGMA